MEQQPATNQSASQPSNTSPSSPPVSHAISQPKPYPQPQQAPQPVTPGIATPEKPAKPKLLLKIIILSVAGLLLASSIFIIFTKKQKEPELKTTGIKKLGFNVKPISKPAKQETTDISDYSYRAVKIPASAKVQEEYKGIKFMRTEKSEFTDLQLKLLKYFIDMTPSKLLNPGPKVILTYAKGDIDFGIGGVGLSFAVALASGNTVLFNSKSFKPTGGVALLADTSIDVVLEIFVHELTHVCQFYSINNDFLKQAKQDKIVELDLLKRSPLVSEFAQTAGWIKDDKYKYIFQLKLKEDEEFQKTTEYGRRQGPQEDMADSVAAYIMGKSFILSEARVQWVKNWLGQEKQQLTPHKIPQYPNLQLTKFIVGGSPVNKETVEEFKNKYPVVDTLTYSTKEIGKIHQLSQQFSQDLNSRGFQGSLTKETDSKGIIYYKGFYTGQYRDLDVLFKSYDEATGFSSKPDGTQLAIISGYKL